MCCDQFLSVCDVKARVDDILRKKLWKKSNQKDPELLCDQVRFEAWTKFCSRYRHKLTTKFIELLFFFVAESAFSVPKLNDNILEGRKKRVSLFRANGFETALILIASKDFFLLDILCMCNITVQIGDIEVHAKSF